MTIGATSGSVFRFPGTNLVASRRRSPAAEPPGPSAAGSACRRAGGPRGERFPGERSSGMRLASARRQRNGIEGGARAVRFCSIRPRIACRSLAESSSQQEGILPRPSVAIDSNDRPRSAWTGSGHDAWSMPGSLWTGRPRGRKSTPTPWARPQGRAPPPEVRRLLGAASGRLPAGCRRCLRDGAPSVAKPKLSARDEDSSRDRAVASSNPSPRASRDGVGFANAGFSPCRAWSGASHQRSPNESPPIFAPPAAFMCESESRHGRVN